MASAVAPGRAGSQAVRKGSPLLLLIGGLLIALVVLPSALNLPQTNPSTTLEYAPVPPTDDDVPPPIGNFDNFGLGDSNSINTGGDGGGGGGATPPGTNIGLKNCVNTPKGLKQTEDPLSPPCNSNYTTCTKNGGATYQGVTGQEIRILFYFDSNFSDINTSKGSETRPTNTYVDLLNDEPKPDDHLWVRTLRAWQKYFFNRYQTYCRTPHFYIYFGSAPDAGPDAKRADAADNYDHVKPFAVVSDSDASNDAYLEAMARRHVLNFGSLLGRESSFFTRFPKLVWNYAPNLETQAKQYVDFFCKQIKPYPNTTFAGPGLENKPRRYGIVFTNDPNHPELQKLKKLVKDGIQNNADPNCHISQPGGIPEATWSPCCRAEDNLESADYAMAAIAKFSDPNQAGGPVTTILWPGGLESKFGDQAQTHQYYPEWIQLGDGQIDGYIGQQYQNPQAFNKHAIVVTWQTKFNSYDTERCQLAYKEADQTAPEADIVKACKLYPRLRQLFTGIQVAGARLGPTSVDKGYHAIPRIASDSPETPACFYDINDYTCVKDGMTMYWDAYGHSPNSSDPGCWRMVNKAQRYLVGEFPSKEFWSTTSPADECNGFRGNATLAAGSVPRL